MLVVDLVEGRLELAGLRVHGELIHDRVVHDERQAVDEAFLGDGLGFGDPGCVDARLRVGLIAGGNSIALLVATGEERDGDRAYK